MAEYSTIRYRDHAISYDKDGMTVVPFIERQTGKEAILVQRDVAGEGGCYLEDLKTQQKLETSIPLELNHTHKNLDVSLTPSGNVISTTRYVLIARVDANAEDTIRAVYAGTEDKIPVFIASWDSTLFNELDVGNLLIIDGYRPEVKRCIKAYDARSILHATVDAQSEKQNLRRALLRKGKAAYVESFLAGDIETIFLDILTITGTKLCYTDTEIVISDKRRLAKAVRMLSQRAPDESTDVLLNQAPSAGANDDDWYGFDQLFFEIIKAAGAAKINGVNLSYEVKTSLVTRPETDVSDSYDMEVARHYINGKKIAKDDVFTVITAASCYADRQKEYDEYVQQISRISLKFHRAVADGLILEDSMTQKELKEGVDGLPPLPNDFSAFEDQVASCRLQVRKEPGRKAEVCLLGVWRQITNFDSFVNSCRSDTRKRRKDHLYFGSFFDREAQHACRKLSLLDNWLRDADKVIPDSVLTEDTGYYRDRGTVIENAATKKAMGKNAVAYRKMFGTSLKKQYLALKRSKALFDRILVQDKVEIINDGKQFIVTGSSGHRYEVSVSGKVIDLSSGRHICIVNGGSRDLGGWDYLSSLIAALVHDSRTAADVYTLESVAEGNAAEAPEEPVAEEE